MQNFMEGRVTKVIEDREGVQMVEVLMATTETYERAIHYTKEKNRLQIDDVVQLNTTAKSLRLGTGGYHFVVAKTNPEIAEQDNHPTSWGHIMKMRYTPWQMSVDAVEEQGSPFHSLFCDEALWLEQIPIIIGELHSLLPLLSLAIKEMAIRKRIVYVMPDGASLPMAWSKHVHHLKQTGILSATVSTGQAWGGDYEAVNLHTGLLTAKHLGKADIIICLLGPGVVGTGTPLGFSGMQMAEMIHAASLLGGVPIVVPRISFADKRERHQGVSHHSRTVLRRFCLKPAIVGIPAFVDERDEVISFQMKADQLTKQHYIFHEKAQPISSLEKLQQEYPEKISSMGRSIQDDPSPFQAAYLCAQIAVWASNKLQKESSASSLCPDVLDTLAKSWSYLKIDEE